MDRAVRSYDRKAWLDAELISRGPFFRSDGRKNKSPNPLIYAAEKKAEA